MTKPNWDVEQLPIVDCEEEKLSALRIGYKFPLPPEERSRLASFLRGLRRWMEQKQKGQVRPEIFIQMTQLPRPGGAAILSRNGSRWMPGLAMGVWPDREPPRSMVKEDFTHRLPGEKFPTLDHEARRILAKGDGILLEVEEQMAGSGALLEIVAPEGWGKKEGRQVSAWLKERIVDDIYRSYPAFVPVLDATSLVHLSRKDREACLAGIDLYLREDLKDGSLLLISRTLFEETLAMIESAMEETATAAG